MLERDIFNYMQWNDFWFVPQRIHYNIHSKLWVKLWSIKNHFWKLTFVILGCIFFHFQVVYHDIYLKQFRVFSIISFFPLCVFYLSPIETWWCLQSSYEWARLILLWKIINKFIDSGNFLGLFGNEKKKYKEITGNAYASAICCR